MIISLINYTIKIMFDLISIYTKQNYKHCNVNIFKNDVLNTCTISSCTLWDQRTGLDDY